MEAKTQEGNTAIEIATMTHGDDQVLRARFEGLVRSISIMAGEIEEVEEFVSEINGAESWKSFEEGLWDETERAAM